MTVNASPSQRLLPFCLRIVWFSAFGGVVFLAGCGRGTASRSQREVSQRENPLEIAQDSLSNTTDVIAVRGALQQLNFYLGEHPEQRPPDLTAEQRALLSGKQFALSNDELAEITCETFTLLDGPYLELCFLFRDAVHALELDGRPQVEQARALFSWVTRQVRLTQGEGLPLPPQFVLRRGFGTALERSLIFLAALQQIGIDGCLVALPGGTASQPRFWTCGTVIGKDVFLFEPRLGMPLPGPDGHGIATLAAVQKAQPDLLGQLSVDSQRRYDVTAEEVRKAECHLVPALSSLAPRMQLLEDGLLGTAGGVRARRNPARLWNSVQSAIGPESALQGWRPGIVALRENLPPDEGGVDKDRHVKAFVERNLIPIDAVHPKLRSLEGRLRDIALVRFGGRFVDFAFGAGKPRDKVLRGRYSEALPELNAARDSVRDQKALLTAVAGLEQRFDEWHPRVRAAYANQLEREAEANRRGHDASSQAALEEAKTSFEGVWKEGARLMGTLVEGSAAEPLGALVIYQLALCMQEQAERSQLRVEIAQNGTDADQQAARNAWREAVTWWETFTNEYPSRPEVPAARLLQARALLALGERERAVTLLSDTSNLSDLEKLARAYQVRQIRKRAK